MPGPSIAVVATRPIPPTPSAMARTRTPRRITYRDPQHRVWYVSEVAQLKVVSPSIDGPNLALVIRFEREGEERFARWIGGEEWRLLESLQRLFAESEGGADAATLSATATKCRKMDSGRAAYG